MSVLMRMLTLIMGQKYNNPLDKKIKVFLTRDSLTEFMGSGLETAGGGSNESGGQSSYFGKLVEPQYSSYVRDEQDLMEMKQSMASFPRRRFDYVVANPPYVSYNESSKQHIPVFEQLKKGKVKLNNIYGVNLHSTPGNPKRYRPNPNLYAFFVALGLALLKDNAKLCYIIPQTFLVNADFDVLRYHLSKSVTLEKILTFSGKMFLGRGLKQNKPIPTSSLIFVASRRPPIPGHVVEIVNYQGKDGQIQDTFANISKGINTVTKTIPQETLLDNISNWNFIKLNPRQLGFYEIYKHNSEDFSSYFQHSIARTRFSDTFTLGKVSKQPPKYERMVAWDRQRNARDAVTVRAGQLDVIKGDVQAVDMSGVLINCLCISPVPGGDACSDGFYWDRAALVSHVRHG